MTPQRGNPTESGFYIGYVASGVGGQLIPKILTWTTGNFWEVHLSTAKWITPDVECWVGPLPKMTKPDVWDLPLPGQDFDL